MMSERTVLASFMTQEEAEAVQQAVQKLGVDTAQVDQRHKFASHTPLRESFLVSGKIGSLANVTLNEQPSSKDSGIMLAADPAASGMADHSDEGPAYNYILTVICDDNFVERIVQIIKDGNGFT